MEGCTRVLLTKVYLNPNLPILVILAGIDGSGAKVVCEVTLVQTKKKSTDKNNFMKRAV